MNRREERNKLPTPAEREENLKKGIAWGVQFESLKGHKAFQRLEEQIKHEVEREQEELLTCDPGDVFEHRGKLLGFKYVTDFVDKFVRLGKKAAGDLDKLQEKGGEN